MRNKEYLNGYIDHLRFEKGLSENSIESYERDLIYFEKHICKEFFSVTEEDIIEYIEKLKENYADSTVQRKITAIKNLYTFFYKNGEMKIIPTRNIDSHKKSKKIPEILSLNEIKDIINAIDTSDKGKRDKIAIKLLVATGGRVSEVVNLIIEDIAQDYSFIRVLGKGNKYRVVPLYKEIGKELKFYIEHVRKNLQESHSNLVFFGLSRNNLWHRIKLYAKNAKINKNVYPHIFRHTIATLMLQNGADIRVVQELLGHADIATTEIYTHLEKSQLKKEFDRAKIGDR